MLHTAKGVVEALHVHVINPSCICTMNQLNDRAMNVAVQSQCWLVQSIAATHEEGQIFLDAFNPILQECIGSRLKEGVRKPCELRVSDFEDVTYRIVVTREAPGTLRLSVSLAAWSYIKGNGGAEMLTAVYPGMAAATPDSGYHITLVVDLDNPTVQPDELLQRYDTNNVYCLKLHRHTVSELARLQIWQLPCA
eukprot:12011-Heterococcus_DN1.PRE.3